MITVTCGSCDRVHAVVLSTKMAHPGREETTRVRVPVEDAYGTRRGHRWETSGRWVPTGASVSMAYDVHGTQEVYTWTCACGAPLAYRQPLWTRVTCARDAGPTGVCRVAATLANPPSDYYVNPRHGASCPCCGFQGAHWVRADQDPATLPACMR